MNAYKGDLSGYEKYTSSFHVGIQLNRKHRVNGNFNMGFGNINGENRNFTFESDQQPLPVPNKFVKTQFFYINYDLHYNIIKKKNVILYFSQGIGLIRFSPEDADGNSLTENQNTREADETYRKESFMLPTSLGAIFILPNQYGVSVQAGFYNTLTDYLDNISNLGDSKKDNILAFRLAFFVPVKFKDEQ
ncbi:hypothetical protein C900_04860 [Fulvivirga imtechensis AK7]|uniref:Outer membrane protein beta-barrel domain-containing protein n=1 Tax=Fulvivirga imtechensis AK7 TaxID=1237149 RepID=L8JLE4_9BACT|nr:hypothetical protein [Fulvivirga imtechensis]ELR69635.1 hypothetical protein C900_04860 [Fulvivirga imtechensis AK7]